VIVISVNEVVKRFPAKGEDVVAVNRVSFSVAAGEVFALLGPNGAGKTTTLRMLLGLLEPTSGEIVVDGWSVSRDPEEVKRRIGLVSASTGLYQWLSPRETLSFFADVYGVPPDVAAVRIEVLAKLLDFGRFIDRRCGNLSTGQKQRVSLARALIHDPPLMLLDEPTRGLDVVGTQVIFEYLGELKRSGKAVIISTHRLDEAERFADRFGLLHLGELKYLGTMPELRHQTGCQSLVEMFSQLLGRSLMKVEA
jgi:sodium transport system ATP-binding protein